jgi:pimeloyl-ACP methyl ester carboxylesterase
MNKKAISSASLLVLGLGLAAYGGYFFRRGYALCHPSRSHASAAETARAFANLPKLREVSFPASDGITLRGWFVPPRNGVVVVMVHGLYANRALLEPEAEVFAKHGYGALLFDSRAHGESDGTTATWGSTEALDNAQAIHFVRAQPGVSRIALLGFSVGASSVSRAVANDSTIGAVILYATWTSLREEVAYKSGAGWLGTQFMLLGFRCSGSHIDEIEPKADMARIAPRPVLMLSGGVDDDTPPWVMDRMFALAWPPKELWREPEVGHGGYFEAHPAEYERRVVGFLDHAFP